MKKPIQVFEFEKLKANDLTSFPDENTGKKIIEMLWKYNDNNNNIYFDAIRNGIKFKNYVGVIQIGTITIEILPKSDKQKSTTRDKDNWHNALLKMLSICKKIRVDSVSEASLKKRYHSLLDLYFELYINEVNFLLAQGLIKKYSNKTGNLNVLKGQINFGKNIQQNLIHKERFFTSHQKYDCNHLINRILYKGLIVLSSITNNSSLKDGIQRTLSRFPEVDNIPIKKSHFEELVANRKNSKYQEAIKIAKMILLNYSPDIKGGSENMIALLFDMNKLWEEYVYRMLSKLKRDDIKVNFQNNQKFWEGRTIRPDIVLSRKLGEYQETFIIDTKWKVLDHKKPKPSDDDLKQMFAYNIYWDAKRSMLLYPNSKTTTESFGNYHKGREKRYFEKENTTDIDRRNQCKIGFVNVLDENNYLNSKIGEEIISKLI